MEEGVRGRKAAIDIVVDKSPSTNTINNQRTATGNPTGIQQEFKISDTNTKNPDLVAEAVEQSVELDKVAYKEMKKSWKNLRNSLSGPKQDALIMLMATAIVIPLFTQIKTSPIVGFMLTGMLLGPSGLNWVRDVHMVDKLGELGIVFFLFEMGLELSLDRLKAMRKDVFGIGIGQFLLTMLAGAGVGTACGLSPPAALTIGGSLSLSSSAFVLQLLKDKNAMGTRYGKAAFGILLLQDLAVVPLFIVVDLLGKGGAGLGKALTIAAVKALVTLSTMSYMGRKLLNPIFSAVARSGSHEAFLSSILSTVLLMAFVTHGIGLSDTLGAFLAGLLLSETSYRYQVEADIAPFRGLLLGLFFITVGFNIDLALVRSAWPTILALLGATVVGKASIATLVAKLFGVPFASAQRAGLLIAQGGELAFVALAIADRSGMIEPQLIKLLLTTVALSMASTPLLAMAGTQFASQIDKEAGFTSYYKPVEEPEVAKTMSTTTKGDFVFICGYGRVGSTICEMLDRKLIPYVVIDKSPQRVIDAKNQGLPVFFGDIERPELLKGFHPEDAKACVLTLDDMSSTNKAVIRLCKLYPNLPIVARAMSPQHEARLNAKFENVQAVAPVVPADSVLLTLPFAGAVLQNIGVPKPEIEAIMEDTRRIHLDDDNKNESVIFGRRLTAAAVGRGTSSTTTTSSSSVEATVTPDGGEGSDVAETSASDVAVTMVDTLISSTDRSSSSSSSVPNNTTAVTVADAFDTILDGNGNGNGGGAFTSTTIDLSTNAVKTDFVTSSGGSKDEGEMNSKISGGGVGSTATSSSVGTKAAAVSVELPFDSSSPSSASSSIDNREQFLVDDGDAKSSTKSTTTTTTTTTSVTIPDVLQAPDLGDIIGSNDDDDSLTKTTAAAAAVPTTNMPAADADINSSTPENLNRTPKDD